MVDVPHPSTARNKILQQESKIISLANNLHPKMVSRGGGAKAVDVLLHPSASARGDMLVVHLLVDTCDAMGANLVNTMCEGVAPLIERITGGQVFLRILSNLTDRAMVRAEARFTPEVLEGKGFSGEQVREGIILANDFAMADPYRATTHNKGIMNGIDAVALATGNDWRAIEAAAHAYAGRGSSYTSLTRWFKDEQGCLVGRIELPLKVGTVGGQMASSGSVRIAQRLIGVQSAQELAEVMAAVGLAQNFAALRALSTEGIQRGHMSLHARSVAVAAGASDDVFEDVVKRLMESGEVKLWKAQEIVAELNAQSAPPRAAGAQGAWGHARITLLGEHAQGYGAHSIAAPVPDAVETKVTVQPSGGLHLVIPRWGIDEHLREEEEARTLTPRMLELIVQELKVADRNLKIEVHPKVPRAMGLGSSAAVAVSIIRGLDQLVGAGLEEAQINALAGRCDAMIHSDAASGLDTTLATYGKPILYKRGEPPKIQDIALPKPIWFVIGISGVEGPTAQMRTRVREGRERNQSLYDHLFKEIDELVLRGAQALQEHNLRTLGELMNICHGLLSALGLSCWELEELISIARDNGALGAKITGEGGGGSMIALCPEDRGVAQNIQEAMQQAGYTALITKVGGAS